jgi:hypothetical protein
MTGIIAVRKQQSPHCRAAGAWFGWDHGPVKILELEPGRTLA